MKKVATPPKKKMKRRAISAHGAGDAGGIVAPFPAAPHGDTQ
jgi:hypothetical protein